MERDFLGISSSRGNSKDSRPVVKGESMADRQDAAWSGSAVQWPFSNKVSSVQHYEEKPKKYVINHFASSAFQPISTVSAFEASYGTPPESAPQKCFTLDKPGIHQFPMHPYQSQRTDSFIDASHQLNEAKPFTVVSNHSVPVPTSSPYFKLHGSHIGANSSATSIRQLPFGGGVAIDNPVVGSVVGGLAPRKMYNRMPMPAQMTIFYAGSVNVYDDVPFDKARAVMLLASRGSNAKSNVSRSDAAILAPGQVPIIVASSDGFNIKQALNPTPIRVVSPCSGLSSPISVTSHTCGNSRSTSSNTEDTAGAKTVNPLAPACQQEPPKTVTPSLVSTTAATIMPRAVPQARKASLARFLEKRKERVSNAMPYACVKEAPEEADATPEKANLSSISATADANLSSNQEGSLRLGRSKARIDGGESPSTKLGI